MSHSIDEGWRMKTTLPARFQEGDYRYQKIRSGNWSVERHGPHGWEHVATINGPEEFVRTVSERMSMPIDEVERVFENADIPLQ